MRQKFFSVFFRLQSGFNRRVSLEKFLCLCGVQNLGNVINCIPNKALLRRHFRRGNAFQFRNVIESDFSRFLFPIHFERGIIQRNFLIQILIGVLVFCPAENMVKLFAVDGSTRTENIIGFKLPRLNPSEIRTKGRYS